MGGKCPCQIYLKTDERFWNMIHFDDQFAPEWPEQLDPDMMLAASTRKCNYSEEKSFEKESKVSFFIGSYSVKLRYLERMPQKISRGG
jgi:hypothetical protein